MLPLMRKTLILFFSCFVLYGCAVNPVTGKNELAFVSESHEIGIGKENYMPSRQMQGGDYTVDPELTAYVNNVGQKLAKVSDRQLPYEFVVLNNSIPNAWALPGGKIAVNRGLLVELNNEAELAAVLAHEIVHAAARHGAQSMERGMMLQGALIATQIGVGGKNYGDLVVGGAQVAAGLIHTKYGRDDELEADYYGMTYMARAGYDPLAAVGLQETFVKLSKNQSHNWLAGLFASHPPSVERVETNRETAKKLPQGGRLGTKTYQEKTAHLQKTRKAYENYDKGRIALEKNDFKGAQSYAEDAIHIEPREGNFYALEGDVNYSGKRYGEALADYDKAISLNNDYFYYYLRRGQTKSKLNMRREAYADLQNSTKLLPTATAYNALGNLELQAGSSFKAREYFSAASTSDSPEGKSAGISLLRLEFPENPGKYVKLAYGLDRNGYLIARIDNYAPLGIRNIRLSIQYPDANGRQQYASRWLRSTIPSGSKYNVNLNLGPYSSSNVLQAVSIRIDSAELAE